MSDLKILNQVTIFIFLLLTFLLCTVLQSNFYSLQKSENPLHREIWNKISSHENSCLVSDYSAGNLFDINSQSTLLTL